MICTRIWTIRKIKQLLQFFPEMRLHTHHSDVRWYTEPILNQQYYRISEDKVRISFLFEATGGIFKMKNFYPSWQKVKKKSVNVWTATGWWALTLWWLCKTRSYQAKLFFKNKWSIEMGSTVNTHIILWDKSWSPYSSKFPVSRFLKCSL